MKLQTLLLAHWLRLSFIEGGALTPFLYDPLSLTESDTVPVLGSV